MSTHTGIAVFVIALVLVGAFVVASYVMARRRREELAAFAAAKGWRYAEEEPLLVDRFTGPPFGLGFGRRAYNVLYGTHDGRALVSFDYAYKTQTSNGKTTTTTTHVFSILAVETGVVMPPLSVDPEGVLDRFVGRITGNDIDLESEDFNRAFTVSCADRKFAFDVLHPQMMEYLMAHPGLGWRFESDSLLVVAEGKRLVEAIDPTLEVMDGITDRVPEFVWMRLRGQG